MKSCRSLPAEKAPGARRIRMLPTGDDPPAVSIASAIASYITEVSAFFFSGRFIRIVRIAPSSVTMTCSVMQCSSGRRVRQCGGGNRLCALGDGGLQPARLHGDVLGKEARERDAARGVSV